MDGLFLYDTEIGRIAIGENGGAIALLRLPGEEVPGTVVQHETELLRKAAEQLREYLRGERKMFDLPLAPEGTAFQKAVWSALQEIPYGRRGPMGKSPRRLAAPRRAAQSVWRTTAIPSRFLSPATAWWGRTAA